MTTARHYIGMAGLHGCMPSCCGTYDSVKDAAEGLGDIHELGKNRRQALRRDLYLELNHARDGNEYCEIIECSCDDPEAHDEN